MLQLTADCMHVLLGSIHVFLQTPFIFCWVAFMCFCRLHSCVARCQSPAEQDTITTDRERSDKLISESESESDSDSEFACGDADEVLRNLLLLAELMFVQFVACSKPRLARQQWLRPRVSVDSPDKPNQARMHNNMAVANGRWPTRKS